MSLVKKIIRCIAEPLCHLFNLCINESTYPDGMKITIIKPLFKANDKHDLTNYRPISLLPQVSKIFEKIIYKQLVDFITKNKIIDKCQFGFIEKSNTTLSHLNLQHFIFSQKSKNKKVASLFLDLKKAFDVVDHNILIENSDVMEFEDR